MLISQLCSRYFQEHQPYICHSICWVKWLRSMAMLPLQCSRLYCQVSLCLAPLHIKQFIRKLCNKGSRDVTFTQLLSPLKTQESLHVHYSPECLSNSQNHVADTSRFLENELGSSACCDHKIRSLWTWHSASEISDWTMLLMIHEDIFSSFCWEKVRKWKIMKWWTCNTCWVQGLTFQTIIPTTNE